MNRSTDGWQLLYIIVLIATAGTAVGAAQSTETAVNTTETPTVTAATNSSATTLPQSPTQTLRSDQATDDVPESATPIEVGNRVTGQLPAGDQDWTQFSLESGGELTVSVTAQNDTNLSAFIYSGQELLESTYVDPGEQVTLTTAADSGGQYYVFIRNEANNTAGAYAFEVSKSETVTSEPTEDTDRNTDGSGGGLGFWVLGLVGAIILVGYVAFRREENNDGEEKADEGEEKENEN